MLQISGVKAPRVLLVAGDVPAGIPVWLMDAGPRPEGFPVGLLTIGHHRSGAVVALPPHSEAGAAPELAKLGADTSGKGSAQKVNVRLPYGPDGLDREAVATLGSWVHRAYPDWRSLRLEAVGQTPEAWQRLMALVSAGPPLQPTKPGDSKARARL